MTPDEIRAAFQTAKRPPAEALRAAAQSMAPLTPAVLAVVDKAAAGILLTPPQARLMFYGLHALAAAREQALYAPLLRLLRRPHAELDRWFGDALEVSLGRVALSVFDGDPAPLITAIEDRRADGTVRWQLFEVLARLAFDGAVPRETALALIDRFERDRLAEDGNPAWIGWAAAIALLGLAERGQRVRVAWSDGRVPLQDVDLRDWEEALARAVAAPADPSRFVDDDLTSIDDPVAALAWVDAAAEGPGDDSRPNDPAAAHALDAEEIDWLAEFLARGPAEATAMSLEEMDGFVTALICGPAPIDPLDRLDHILGATGDRPASIDEEQNSFLRELLTRHKTAIAARLAAAQRLAPLIAAEEEDGKLGGAWARGFLRGVFQDGDAWEPLARDERFHMFLGAVMALDSSRSTEADRMQTPADRRKLVDALPTAILGIHGFWREHRAVATQPQEQPREQPPTRPQPWRRPPPLRPSGKVGRNDPCPCGSGKKFKRCCALLTPALS